MTTRVTLIGTGGMARHHIRQMIQPQIDTMIPIVCEPSQAAYDLISEIFDEAGLQPPHNEPDLERLLQDYDLDAAFIITPHVFHHDQAKACLQAGLDVLLEKPMVMNAEEARSLIDVRDNSGRLLVVAFSGSISPQIRKAVAMLRSGELGEILSVSATVWQGWASLTEGTWRQDQALSGGGFLFDTGAHMLNTITDLVGEDFVQVSAWMDNNGWPVDTEAVVMARLASGALVTMHANGETIDTCLSDVQVFCSEAILHTGVWGEKLELHKNGEREPQPVEVHPSLGVWDQFLLVRSGDIANPCPPEVGLRMAKLYDAILASAAQNGAMVRLI